MRLLNSQASPTLTINTQLDLRTVLNSQPLRSFQPTQYQGFSLDEIPVISLLTDDEDESDHGISPENNNQEEEEFIPDFQFRDTIQGKYNNDRSYHLSILILI